MGETKKQTNKQKEWVKQHSEILRMMLGDVGYLNYKDRERLSRVTQM